MANKHVKRCPTSLGIKKVQVQIRRHHSTLTTIDGFDKEENEQ